MNINITSFEALMISEMPFMSNLKPFLIRALEEEIPTFDYMPIATNIIASSDGIIVLSPNREAQYKVMYYPGCPGSEEVEEWSITEINERGKFSSDWECFATWHELITYWTELNKEPQY